MPFSFFAAILVAALALTSCTASEQLIKTARDRVQSAREIGAAEFAPDHLAKAEQYLADAERLNELKNAEANTMAQQSISAADRAIEVSRLELSLRGLEGQMSEALADSRRENARLRDQIAELVRERDHLRMKVENLTRDIDAARTEHEANLSGQMSDNLELSRKRDALAASFTAAMDEKANLSAAMAELGEKSASLEARLEQITDELSRTIEDRQSANDERSAIASRLDVATGLHKARESELLGETKRLGEELEGAWVAAKKEAERLTDERDSYARALGELWADHDELVDSISFVRSMNLGVTEENEKLMTELSEVSSEQVRLKEEAGKIVLTFVDKILFRSGSADLEKDGQAVLGKVASVIKKYPERLIQIGGHTDTVPISTRQYPSNWELSTARAVSVLRYLLKVEPEIEPTRLVAAGFGEFRPVDVNTTDEGRRENRRVEIIVLRGEY